MNTHTTEPWLVFDGDKRAITAIGNPMLSLMTIDDDGLAIMYSEADARRAVVCVNACAGLDTEAIEGASFREFVVSNINLKAQRKELQEELEKAHKIISNALGLMNSGMKFEWGNRNALNDCEGEGITRANERKLMIERMKGGAA